MLVSAGHENADLGYIPPDGGAHCGRARGAVGGWASAARAARDTLTIGITQYPSTFNPNIDSMLAKTYVLAMTSPAYLPAVPGPDVGNCSACSAVTLPSN